MSRSLRRAAAHRALKLARKAARLQTSTQQEPSVVDEQQQLHATTTTVEAEPIITDTAAAFDQSIPEPGYPFPSLKEISPARLAANRANAQKSTGATSDAGRQASSRNHTIHGLARHENGCFKLLASENPEAFAAFQQSVEAEHAPQTETESILVNAMIESHWLAQRAQRLQDHFLDPHSGLITDSKQFSLYLRYQTTHTRAFHRSLNDLLKLRAEKRKAELGFEAQRIQSEKHEMKKHSHYWEVLKKDGEACHQISLNTLQNLKAQAENPSFNAQYNLELAKFGIERDNKEAAKQTA
jgi:hypothetical protein